MSAVPFAHELWFEDRPFPADWSFAGEGTTLALLAGALAVAVAVRLLARMRSGVDVPALAALAPWMPFAVRVHLAVSLVGMLSMGAYLSPAMDLADDVPGLLLGAVSALVAIGMATGFRTREAAWLLIFAGPLGAVEFGPGAVAQRLDLLGLAVFLLFTGPGRWSADHERGAAGDASVPAQGAGIWALRVGAGLALIVVAFREKLAYPELAVHFLGEHPELNVARQAGLDMSHLEFARVAGAIEVLFGLLLISGALPQACVLIAGVPFNATLWFFGTDELIGHLPTYGAMLVLLVFGSDPALRAETARLTPPWWRGRRAATPPVARSV